mgnify:CR=1 FL=1
MGKAKKTIPYIAKAIIGILFIISAIAKIVGMDKFEIYIYSYHFFSLNLSFIVARLAIIAELVLGIGLLSMVLHKPVWWASTLMTAGYTLFLLYAALTGRTDSCHCFGELVEMNPWQSIAKNAVLLAILAIAYFAKDVKWRFAWPTMIAVAIACGVTVFCVSPPDNFTPGYNREGNIDTKALGELITTTPLDTLGLDTGKQTLCFFTPGCEFCQLAARKITLMQQYYGSNPDNLTYIFLMGDEESVNNFFEKSESERYRHIIYPDFKQLLACIDGEFPTIAFLDNGKLVYQCGLRDMHEDKVKAFFAHPQPAP